MTSHSTESDSMPAASASEEKSPGMTASSPGSSQAGESQSAEWPYRDIDPRTGRLRPISDEEWRARMEELTKELEEIDAQDDTPEEVYDEITKNLEKARDHHAAEWPYRDIDPRTGRLRPISDEELQARYEDLRRRLAEIDAHDDTPHEVYDEVLRGIDEERRRQGRPPAFEGCY